MLDIISLGEPLVEFCATRVGRLKDVFLFKRGWGGDTSNVLVTAARLGRTTGYITRVGDDEFGKCFLEMWRREGVDISHVVIEKNGFTGVYFILLTEEGKHEFIYYRKNSAASHLSPSDIDPNYIKQSKIFHSSGISQAISKSCREAVFKAAEIAKKAGVLFSYDPNVRLKLWPINVARNIINYTLELADIVIPSLEDAKLFTGLSSPSEIADIILKSGPSIVVIKLGSQGCLVATKREKTLVPSFPVDKVVDTTGAGDAFTGAFLAALLEGQNPKEAARFANAVAALKTLGRGAVASLPTRKRVEKFLSHFKSRNSLDRAYMTEGERD